MALNFNAEPYYDDFNDTKNYHRILFRPGYAVQARELTQLQTQLQDQIAKFGKHIFVDGTVVLDGQRFFENNLVSIRIGSNLFGNLISAEDIIGQTLTGVNSETQATIKAITTESGAGNVLVVKVTSGTEFTEGEDVTIKVNSSTYLATINASNAITPAMMFSVDTGVYFVRNKFVYCNAQSIVVDAASNTSSKNIGFTVNEIVTTAEQDETLLDNAQGTPNYAAPGADRYTIDLVLTAKDLNTTINNFTEIARVVNGELVVNLEKTIYSEIGNELARRTFDESGDYTVKPWKLQLEDHPTDVDLFIAALEPGKGYIKGYEFETINQTPLEIDRARDVAPAIDADIAVSYGNYVFVDTLSGVFNTSSLESVSLKDDTSPTPVTIGTAKVRALKYVSGTIGSGAVYQMYLFDVLMNTGKFFKEVRTITSTTGSATIDALSLVPGVLPGTYDTVMSGADAPGLVFPIGQQFVKTVRESLLVDGQWVALNASKTGYQLQRVFTASFGTDGKATISTVDGAFVGSGALTSTLKNSFYHVVATSASNGISTGDVINFSVPGTSTVERVINVVTSQQVEFDLKPSEAITAFTASIIATINVDAQLEKTKTLSDYLKGIISTNPINQVVGGKDLIGNASGTPGISDVYDILGVYNIGSNSGSDTVVNSANGTITWGSGLVLNTNVFDVTANYVLDNGQRAEYYDHAALVLTGTAPTSSTDNLLVVYRNFSHSGTGFCTVNSYGIDYEDIPTFTDPASGRVFQLRDCIDFRPRKQDGGSTLVGAQIPAPVSNIELDFQYYMGRMDRIIAMPDRTFLVKRGIPSLRPVLPVNDTNGMVIYEMVIPPYTTTVNDITFKYVDNKRYTMRDIGKIDTRVKNLEYYTQLSLLEKQAKDTSIPDSSNFEKFKNGIAVDPFTSQDIFVAAGGNWSTRRWGWWNAWFNGSNSWNSFGAQNYNENSIADAGALDFNAAIDPLNQELRAPFEVDRVEFDTTTLTNTVKPGNLVTLSFTETSAISQLLATTFININPFDVIKFIGKVTLEPPFDNWIDTVTLPAVNKVVDVRVPDAEDLTVRNITGQGNAVRIDSRSTSIVTNVVGSSTTSLGTSVVDVQYVPYIRASKVVGVGRLFKPNARLYPFVDNTPVDSRCRPLTTLTVDHVSGSLFDDTEGAYETLTFTGGATAKVALYTPPIDPTSITPNRRLLYVFDVNGTISSGNTVTGSKGGTATVAAAPTTYSLGASLVPNQFGSIAFEFDILPGTFKTGERTIRLIDNNANDVTLQDSFGEAKYTATGQIQSKRETILTTRTVQNQRVTVETGQRIWVDPVAQTFLVDALAYPEGMFVSSVEVYFRTKSNNIPVTMQIRRTANGYPESVPTIPFSEVTLDPEQVSVSTLGTAATKFTFASPVHLVPGEYAIVLLANSTEYNVFVAEMGQLVLGGARIVDKQPYTGSLFISQNASTWTADQNKDLKFNINRAEFASSGTALFEIQDPTSTFDYYNLFVNSSVIAPSNTAISWEMKAYNASGSFDANYVPVNINQDIDFPALKRLIAKASTPGNVASLLLRATLSTSNSSVSPAIDGSSLAAITAVNSINNDTTGETGKQGGNAIAKYITKPIVLADGFDASNLCVTVDVNKPAGTDIKVYYKALPTEKATPISEEVWNEMVIERSVTSSTSTDYREHRFFPSGAFSGGVPVDGPIDARFNTFQIKIVLTSSTATLTPKLRDLRIIALDE